MQFFPFSLLTMVDNIDGFLNIETTLYSWNELHFVVIGIDLDIQMDR